MRVFLLQTSGMHTGGGYQMPLSLPSLGAYIKQRGHKVTAVDMNFPSHLVPGRYLNEDPELVARIVAFRPDVLGISTTTSERHNARFWAGLMKGYLPDLKVVIGGPHVSYTSRQILERWKAVDYVIRFEGELPFAMLLERLSSGGSLDDVPALSYRDADGEVRETERAGLITDLDTLPMPDWDVFEDIDEMVMNYRPIVSRDGPWISGPTIHTMTSRGCPFLCRFCSTSHFWQGKTRFRSPEKVIHELRWIKMRWPAVQNIIFHDDTITVRKKHIRRICELIIEEGLQFRWKAWSRLDVLDKDLLHLMKQAGCVCLLCGVESGTDRGLELVGKKLNLPRLLENTKMIEESGMNCLYSFIAGIPGESPADSMATVRLARRLQSPQAVANVYFGTSIFPGTAFCHDLEAQHGPIDWEDPAPSIRPLFGFDPYGNPTAPDIGQPQEVVAGLAASMGLPPASQSGRTGWREAPAHIVNPERLRFVRQWSPYILPQLQELESAIAAAATDPTSNVLSLSGRGKESLLATALADRFEHLNEVVLPEPVLQGWPEADHLIDELFRDLPSGGYRLVVDLNSVADLRDAARARVLAHLRRILAADGSALFFYQNPDHLMVRAARFVGRRSRMFERRPPVDAFCSILREAGFAIDGGRSAGLALPAIIGKQLPASLFNALGGVRLPRPLASWSLLICRPARVRDVAPVPASSAIERPGQSAVALDMH